MTIFERETVHIHYPHRCWGCDRFFPAGSMLTSISSVTGNSISQTLWWCLTCLAYWVKERVDYEASIAKRVDWERWEVVRKEVENPKGRINANLANRPTSEGSNVMLLIQPKVQEGILALLEAQRALSRCQDIYQNAKKEVEGDIQHLDISWPLIVHDGLRLYTLTRTGDGIYIFRLLSHEVVGLADKERG